MFPFEMITPAAVALTAANVGVLTYVLRWRRQLHKVLGEAEALRATAQVTVKEAEELLEHAVLLDRVMTAACTKSFSEAHLPIWAAWAQTMGHFKIEMNVTATRSYPEE